MPEAIPLVELLSPDYPYGDPELGFLRLIPLSILYLPAFGSVGKWIGLAFLRND